jgi:hypothetical protein
VLLGNLASASPSKVEIIDPATNQPNALRVSSTDSTVASPNLFSAGNVGYTSSDCSGTPLVVARIDGTTSAPTDLGAFVQDFGSLDGSGRIVYATADSDTSPAVLPTVYSQTRTSSTGVTTEVSPRSILKMGKVTYASQTVTIGADPVLASQYKINSVMGTITSATVGSSTVYGFIPGLDCTALTVTSDPGSLNSLSGALWDIYSAFNYISVNQTRWVMGVDNGTLSLPNPIKLPLSFK